MMDGRPRLREVCGHGGHGRNSGITPVKNYYQDDVDFLSAIITKVAQESGTSEEVMKSTRRHKHLVRARWRVMSEAYLRGASIPRIARALSRDPKTVYYGLRQSGVR